MKYLLLLLFFFSSLIFADETPQHKLFMLTDSGRILLDTVVCEKQNETGFLWRAEATEADSAHTGTGVIIHKACWLRDGDTIYIWFYDEQPEFVVPRNKTFFRRM